MAKGKGSGPGRPKGSKSKRTLAAEELRAKLLDEGESPLEVMTRYYRGADRLAQRRMAELEAVSLAKNPPPEQVEALTLLTKETRLLMQAAHECARDAAPYYHPKLANIEVEGSMTLTLEDALAQLD